MIVGIKVELENKRITPMQRFEKLVQTREWCTGGFQVSYRMMFIREIVG
jgi:hypothetical protein